MRLLFALLAVLTLAGVIGFWLLIAAARGGGKAAELRDSLLDSLAGYELWLAFTVALVGDTREPLPI